MTGTNQAALGTATAAVQAARRLPGAADLHMSEALDHLSAATRKRLLAALLARAEAGDVEASVALVRLSFMRGEVIPARCPIAAEAPA